MPKLLHVAPKYRRHIASGQAVVTLDGVDHYLGAWKSPASRVEYDRLIGEWLANGRRLPVSHSDLTILELAERYRRFAEGYYVKDGEPTGAIFGIRVAIRFLREHYGRTRAAEFGPLALKALQQKMIAAGHSRRYLNNNIDRIRRLFKWAVSEELIPPSVHQALASVPGLRRGRSAVRETLPVRPVDDETVARTLDYLPAVVADMVRFQRLTGCRPGEVCSLRPRDLDTSGEVWLYTPESHKTQHHGRDRVIFVGPHGQDVLQKYLLRGSDEPCFSPAESERVRYRRLRETRRTPVQPSQRDRRKLKPKRRSGSRYDPDAYNRAIARGCAKAGVTRWTPNRLRHTAATEIRKRYGLEAAQIVLGHSRADVTQVYAERDRVLGLQVARQIG